MQTLPMKKLIFIDESSSYLNDPCLYGRSLMGDRVLSHKSTQSRTMISLIGAVALTGIVSIMYGVWNTTGDIFKTFIRKYLLPNLKKGQIVILDNARIHKVEGIKRLIESAGARLLFLPPYSPDFSPIELMWSKLKNYLRRNTTGSLAEYHQALLDGLHDINDEDFEAWYDHCGYSASI